MITTHVQVLITDTLGLEIKYANIGLSLRLRRFSTEEDEC